MKIGFLITARMKSTRLPKKITLEIGGRQIIRLMIDRLKLNTITDNIVICTSTNPQDDILQEIAIEENIKYFRGSEEDVIQRLYAAAKFHNFDYVLNITADCPLVAISYIDIIVKKYKQTNADYITCEKLPHGFYLNGMRIDALKKVCEIKKGQNTEVWGRYFTDTGYFNVVELDVPAELQRPDYRLTLDYQEDYLFFQKVFEHFGEKTIEKDVHEILEYLDANPDVVDINKHCEELYLINIAKQDNIEI
jgi:spore coat polysaccharide biosynthesis protein SpsF